MPRVFLGFFAFGMWLVSGHALAEPAPRVRAASPIQQIASEVLPRGDGFAPETPAFCILPESRNIVALWRANRLDSTGLVTHGIWWRYFSEALVPLSDPVPVGQEEEGFGSRNEWFPKCAPTGGGFLAVWDHRLGDFLDRSDVFGQMFRTDGSPVTAETAFTEDRSVSEYAPEIVRTSDGDVLVAWTTFDIDFLRWEVFVRRFDATGNPLGGDESLLGAGASDETNRELATIASAGDRVLAAWSEVVPPGDELPDRELVFARSLSSDGAPFLVGDNSAAVELCADIAMNERGGVVLWVASKQDLRMRSLDTSGQPTGSIHTLESIPVGFIADGPALAAAPDGSSYLVVWGIDDRQSAEVILRAQLLDAYGVPVGAPYTIEDLDSDDGFLNKLRWPAVTYVSPTSVVVGWEYFRQPRGPVAYIELHVQLLEIGSMERECGDADDDGFLLASDGLATLRAAVGLAPCEPCLCDIDNSGTVTAINALAILRAAVGHASDLSCPPCEAAAPALAAAAR